MTKTGRAVCGSFKKRITLADSIFSPDGSGILFIFFL